VKPNHAIWCFAQVYKDPSTNKTFYFNAETQESQWEKPVEFEEGLAAIWGTGWAEGDDTQEVHEVQELSDLGV